MASVTSDLSYKNITSSFFTNNKLIAQRNERIENGFQFVLENVPVRNLSQKLQDVIRKKVVSVEMTFIRKWKELKAKSKDEFEQYQEKWMHTNLKLPRKSKALCHEATVIIFHGSGDDAANFSRVGVYKDNPESRQSIKDAYKVVEALIAEEASNGIPPEKIVVGGFSMGGGLALHAGIKVNRKLAGIFAIGAFLHHDSMVYEELEKRGKESNAELSKIFMTHCNDDTVVPLSWSQEAYNRIKEQGVRIAYHLEPYGGHTVGPSQMDWVDRFIRKCLQ